jgi:hypothetical protein
MNFTSAQIGSEKREHSVSEFDMEQPEGSVVSIRPQRLSDPTACEPKRQSDGQDGHPREVLREHSIGSDSEHGLLTDQGDPSVVIKPSLNIGKREYPRPEGRIYGHKRLSDRYIAGRIDADGCISVVEENGRLRTDLSLSSNDYDALLWIVHSLTPPSAPFLWGGFHQKSMAPIAMADGRMLTARFQVWEWRVAGTRAIACLMRLHNYFVAQKAKAALAMALHREPATRMIEWRGANFLAEPPKHPTRPWTAGFIDGNGSFTCQKLSRSAVAMITVAAPPWKLPALELLNKQYGGGIYKNHNSESYSWKLGLAPSKIRAFLDGDGIAKHLITKRPQAYFLLGCAAMGHLRDGETIAASMRALNSRPHRLSEMDAGLVTDLLKQVRDLPRMRQSEAS